MDGSGNLWGTTAGFLSPEGGPPEYLGTTIFKLTRRSTKTVFYMLSGPSEAGLSMDKAGNLYGTTSTQGPFVSTPPGMVFELVHHRR